MSRRTHRSRISVTIEVDVWHGAPIGAQGEALDVLERNIATALAGVGIVGKLSSIIRYTEKATR